MSKEHNANCEEQRRLEEEICSRQQDTEISGDTAEEGSDVETSQINKSLSRLDAPTKGINHLNQNSSPQTENQGTVFETEKCEEESEKSCSHQEEEGAKLAAFSGLQQQIVQQPQGGMPTNMPTDLVTTEESIPSQTYPRPENQFASGSWRDYGWNWQPSCNAHMSRDYFVNYTRESLHLPPLVVTCPPSAGNCNRDDEELSDLDNEFVSAQPEVLAETVPSSSKGDDSLMKGADNSDACTRDAAPDSKYQRYAVHVDPCQEDQAVEILLFSMSRPHMRGFHFAWISFFIAFFTWFAMTPLLSEIAYTLKLDHKEIWTSSSLAVAGSAVTRILIGPINDKYGARWAMCGTLIFCAIPTLLAGAVVHNSTSLYIVRTFIGIAGSSFVTSQYWTSSMFTKEVSGTANALVAGWGNLGGGMAQITMGTFLFPLFKLVYAAVGFDNHSQSLEQDSIQYNAEKAAERAWRTVLIFPACISLVMVYAIIRYSDDIPKGNIGKRRRLKLVPDVSVRKALTEGANDRNTWILFLQYGCCFGVEITITNAAALYFKERFGQTTETAAAIASVFGLMNLFARGVGGLGSDITNALIGMRGRLYFQVVTLLCEGLLVILFSIADTLAGAIMVMIFFSIFVQAAEGSTFGIVPYINNSVIGSIAGIVGAGGNVVGVAFSLFFREFSYRNAFVWMGITIISSAFFTALIRIEGHRSLFGGEDNPEVLRRRQMNKEQRRNNIGNDHDSSHLECQDFDKVSGKEENDFEKQL